MATRLRTYDMLACAAPLARRRGALDGGLFSLEMWGGATFDTAMRFLSEDPWERLHQLRAAIPNICFQMLFRGSNAVGYSNYPPNVVAGFVAHAAAAGMDIFRIFDSLNYLPNLRVAMEAVQDTHAICEAAICYTGNILDERREDLLAKVKKISGDAPLPPGWPVLFETASEFRRERYIYPYPAEGHREAALEIEDIGLDEIVKAFIGGAYVQKRAR